MNRIRISTVLRSVLALTVLQLLTPLTQAENLSEVYIKAQRNDPAIREAEANAGSEQHRLMPSASGRLAVVIGG